MVKIQDLNEAYTGEGKINNSRFLNNLNITDAKEKIIVKLKKKNWKKKNIISIKDWGISRQSYWGCPIPMIYLEDGTVFPVDKSELPIELPDDIDLKHSWKSIRSTSYWKNTIHKKLEKGYQRN